MTAAVKTLPPQSFHQEAEAMLYLSHSSTTLMETCGFKYDARYNKRLESQETSVNLGFGGAYDQAVSAYVVGNAFGHSLDVPAIFEEEFNKWASTRVVDYSSKWKGQQAVVDAGKLLAERFMLWWDNSGFQVMLDPEGRPLVQRELRVMLSPNVTYTSILDFIVLTPDEKVALMDLKTPATASSELFARTSGQLTGQQLCVQAHAESLGIASLDKVGFLDAVKRPVPQKKDAEGPVVLNPHLVDIRTPEQVQAYIQSRLWIAEDIRRRRFAKRSLDSFNSPCNMCEFARYCTEGSMEGLKVRPPRSRAAVAPKPV